METAQYLRTAMGHDGELFDEYVKAHDAYEEDLLFFPSRESYGLASVASNADKLLALQDEFENVKMRMVDETKKADRLQGKITVLTRGYQVSDFPE